MHNLVQKMCILVLLLNLTGCAYVEYKRVYDIQPEISVSQRLIVNDVIEHYFLSKGYILKQKYHDYYPNDIYLTVMGLPQSQKEDERREFTLSISVSSTGLVKLSHSEHFLQSFSKTPEDVLERTRAEIISKVKEATGNTVELKLSQRSYD